MKYSDEQRIEKIRELIDKLLEYLKKNDITREVVAADETVRWTITTPLYNIGEHAYNLSSAFKEKNKTIPWTKISGLRHRLVHDYEDTNWDIVNQIIFETIPEFKNQLEDIDN